ncbi:MAG: LysR family transcriptional regulator [Burkholderiales bacterium]|nr:LysR family transcriptional regulator [Burkholderiales bacterium]
MKLSALQALVAAVEEGSFRGAARRLGVSQPALTKTLRELELELSTTLVERSTRGVTPTLQGKVLYERALNVARELTAATDAINQMGGNMVGTLSVSAVPLAVMLLLPEAARTFGRDFPGVKLRIVEELYMAHLPRLRRREVDVAIGGIPDDLASGEYGIEPLMTTRMVPVVRKGHPLAGATSLADLGRLGWIYTGVTSDAGYATTLFAMHQLPAPPVAASVTSTLALLALLGRSDYAGLLPEQLCTHPIAAQFVVAPPVAEAGLPLQIGAVARHESLVLPSVRHFIAHLHRAAYRLTRETG